MWGYVLAGTAGLTWFVWWVRRPHHHRTTGGRSGEGPFPSFLTVDDEEQPPPDPRLPRDYDGD
jgi:hypothetical protein